jgi:hypothetical protein
MPLRNTVLPQPVAAFSQLHQMLFQKVLIGARVKVFLKNYQEQWAF